MSDGNATPFNSVRGNRPGRSVFDLSYEKKFTADFGYLYPIVCDEMVPGDTFKIGAECVVRTQPLLAPMLHRVDISAHYFFVPYRLLWRDWEEFITGGEDGLTNISNPSLEPAIPLWRAVFSGGPVPGSDLSILGNSTMAAGSLWDFLGFNTIEDSSSFSLGLSTVIAPLDFPRRAYNMVWWEFFRDENLQKDPLGVRDSISAVRSDKFIKDNFVGQRQLVSSPQSTGREGTNVVNGSMGNHRLLKRSWCKDYFTSALPFQQKGDTPGLPISGSVPVQIADLGANTNPALIPQLINNWTQRPIYVGSQLGSGTLNVTSGSIGVNDDPHILYGNSSGSTLNGSAGDDFQYFVDLENAITFDVSDIRLAFQVQRWLELNARAGSRYTEFLKAHYGVSPTDARLQRPEYIGGVKMPLIISEVLQTSNPGSSPTNENTIGAYGGHAISVDGQGVGSYFAEEFGVIIGLMSIMPKPAYQQGLNRQWSRRSPLDFYSPEFANLSEQQILNKEIYLDYSDTDANNNAVFGYQGVFDEMRYKPSMVHGLFRHGPTTDGIDGFSFWHLGRVFNTRPNLNAAFIEVDSDGDQLKRCFPVPSEPPFFISWGNNITGIRPMPFSPDPGQIDHVF